MAQQAYVSPNRFRLGAFGVDLTGFTNAQLRQKLVQSTGQVDTWCNRSMNPERSDFRGGQIVGEQHVWPVTTPYVALPGDRRVYLNSGPIKSVEAFSIQFTSVWSIDFPPSNLFINKTQGYVEVVATQPTIIGYPPFALWLGPSEPVVSIDYTYGWDFVATDDPCEADSPTLYYASHGNWKPSGDVTIKVGGVTLDPSDYTISEDDGSVLLETEPTPSQSVTASYTYVLPQAISDATALVATSMIGDTSIARRGMLGLSSLRVAEVTLTRMQPGQVSTRNGVSIPAGAAALLQPYALGRIG